MCKKPQTTKLKCWDFKTSDLALAFDSVMPPHYVLNTLFITRLLCFRNNETSSCLLWFLLLEQIREKRWPPAQLKFCEVTRPWPCSSCSLAWFTSSFVLDRTRNHSSVEFHTDDTKANAMLRRKGSQEEKHLKIHHVFKSKTSSTSFQATTFSGSLVT